MDMKTKKKLPWKKASINKITIDPAMALMACEFFGGPATRTCAQQGRRGDRT